MLEELMICKSGALTQDGSKYLDMRTISSSTGTTTRSLMSNQVKMKRAKLLVSGAITEVRDNSGKLFTLTNLRDLKLKEYPKILVSISIDRSILNQNFHLVEWQNVLEQTMLQ